MAFNKLKKDIRGWLKDSGFEVETPIQKKAFDIIERGKDALIIAPTGYGKTLAAILPLFNKYSGIKERGIKILYICPLKALNRDIFERIVELGSRIWMEVDIRHGDTKKSIRRLQTKIPPDVLITTPESLQAILVGKKMREHLKKLKAVVIDEIHEMVGSKRGAQLNLAIERLRMISENFQTIGISATIRNKEEVRGFVSENCETIEEKGEKEYDIKIEECGEDKELAEHLMISPRHAYAIKRISGILEKTKSAIIFTNTRETAELLGTKLKEIREDVEVHHSSLSKSMRISAEHKMKLGKIRAIVATSSLELGIDIGHIDTIIQFSSPRQVVKLVQRVGRSGHGVGRVSRGYIICPNKEEYVEAKAILNLLKKGWMEKERVIKKPYDVLCHQIVGFCMDMGEIRKEELFKRIKKSLVFRELGLKEFERVLDIMKRIGLIGGSDRIYRTRKGLVYYFENLSMIPDERNYFVIDEENKSRVGILHQGFVAQHIIVGSKFIMSGRVWKVTEIKNNRVYVIREKSRIGAIPSWEGELIPVSEEIAKETRRILGEKNNIFLEKKGEHVIIYTWLGSKKNNALAQGLAAIISQDSGTSIGVRSDPYSIVLKGPGINMEKIKELLKKDNWLKDTLKMALPNSSMFLYRFWHVAKRFGIIKKDAEINKHRIRKLVHIFKNDVVVEETFKEIFFEKMDFDATKETKKMAIKERVWGEESEAKISSITGQIMLSDEREILERVRERLLKKRFFFQCTNCWEKIGTFSLENLPKKCHNCGSKLLGFVVSTQKERASKGFLRKTAPLYLYYKRDACFVMGGFGIGPQTAIRILSIPYKEENELVKRIIEAERKFLRTRRFWG